LTGNGKDLTKMSYEEAIRRLEEIVRRLEDEEIPLEESLACFQEGISLSRHCRERLAGIEYRVEYLLKDEQAAAPEAGEYAGSERQTETDREYGEAD
jgi:exodeoxyribonuclease VII small subunit